MVCLKYNDALGSSPSRIQSGVSSLNTSEFHIWNLLHLHTHSHLWYKPLQEGRMALRALIIKRICSQKGQTFTFILYFAHDRYVLWSPALNSDNGIGGRVRPEADRRDHSQEGARFRITGTYEKFLAEWSFLDTRLNEFRNHPGNNPSNRVPTIFLK